MIDADAGTATFKGETFHRPCTLETGNAGSFMKPVPLDLFSSIDFSRIEKVDTVGTSGLGIYPCSWACVFLEKRIAVAPTSLPRGKRCSC
jgi:hypothetical protein